MKQTQKIAIVILTFNGRDNLETCLNSLLKQTYPNLVIYHYDQNSDDGSYEFVKENFPEVLSTKNKVNTGFAGGNNTGIHRAFKDGADFCLLLNDDTEAQPRMVEDLYRTYQNAVKKNTKVGLIQPTILLFDKRKKINSIGNAINYLGFGYCKDFMKTYSLIDEDQEIASASGAGMLISRKYYETVGVLDEDFFMYNEDQNYSWRGLMQGFTHYVSAKSILYHKYDFHRRPFKIYHSEKNRLMILLENYSLKTLLLISPILLLNELFALAYSPFGGYFTKKLSSYWYVMTHMGHIFRKRKTVQSVRTAPDREIIKKFEPDLEFDVMNNTIFKHIVNPLYRGYYRLLMRIL